MTALKQRLRETKLAPEDLAGSAGNLAARLAQQADKADPAELQDKLAGLDKMVGLLKPVLASAAPDVASDVDAKFAATQSALDKLKGPDGSPGKADAPARQALTKAFEDLAAALSHINAAIGLG